MINFLYIIKFPLCDNLGRKVLLRQVSRALDEGHGYTEQSINPVQSKLKIDFFFARPIHHTVDKRTKVGHCVCRIIQKRSGLGRKFQKEILAPTKHDFLF
jgi:hypothetical protein